MKKVLLFVAACVMSIAANAQVDLTIEDFTINAGESKTVDLNMTNDVPVTGIQLDIVTPEGLTATLGAWNKTRTPNWYDEDEEETKYSHSKEYSYPENNIMRILIYSMKNDPETGTLYTFKGTEGGFVKIKFAAASTFEKGEIKITAKKLADTNGKEHNPAETTTSVNGATGITNIVAESLEGAKFFGADGVQTNGAQKGLNIVKTNNGVRKVMVK